MEYRRFRAQLCRLQPSATGQEAPKLLEARAGILYHVPNKGSTLGIFTPYIGQGRSCLTHLVRTMATGIYLCLVPFLIPTGYWEGVYCVNHKINKMEGREGGGMRRGKGGGRKEGGRKLSGRRKGRIEEGCGGRSVGKRGRMSGECCLPTPYTLEPAQNLIPVLTMAAGAGPMAAPLDVFFILS